MFGTLGILNNVTLAAERASWADEKKTIIEQRAAWEQRALKAEATVRALRAGAPSASTEVESLRAQIAEQEKRWTARVQTLELRLNAIGRLAEGKVR